MKQDTLHITNGDSAAGLIMQSGVPGKVLPWRDPMHHGPFPADATLESASACRAHYLAEDLAEVDAALHDFRSRDSLLRSHSDFAETVLWFEHDLLDQLQILQILNELERTDGVSIICINQFPGIDPFLGLGQLTPEQIATLFAKRIPITPQHVSEARRIWALFCQPNPRPLADLCLSHNPLLPFLSKALQRHFQEYPWCTDGLTRTERQLLRLVREGVNTPGRMFIDNMSLETVLFIGDWRTFHTIDALASGSNPLLIGSTDAYQPWRPANDSRSRFLQQRLMLTDAAYQILDQTLMATEVMHRDQWLGGVHILSPDKIWMWNGESRQLIQP